MQIDDRLSVTYQWYVCVAFVEYHLGMAASRMYLDAHFKKENKATVRITFSLMHSALGN